MIIERGGKFTTEKKKPIHLSNSQQQQQQQTMMKSVENEFIGNEGFKINSRAYIFFYIKDGEGEKIQ